MIRGLTARGSLSLAIVFAVLTSIAGYSLSGCNLSAPGSTGTTAPETPAIGTPVVDISALADQIEKGAHDSIVSPDKRLELLIPEGALPAGRKASDVQITPLKVKSPNLAYQLEPDGLRLAKPTLIRITSDLTNDGGTPVLLTMSSDGVISELTPNLAKIDRVQRRVIATAVIEHFSVVYDNTGVFSLNMTDPLPEHLVGEPFTIEATVAQFKNKYLIEAFVRSPDGVLQAAPERNEDATIVEVMKFYGFWAPWRDYRVHEPSFVFDAPAEMDWNGSAFTVRQQFTCSTDGRSGIWYHARILTVTNFKGVEGIKRLHAWHHIESEIVVTCKHRPTPTATPWPTPPSILVATTTPTATPTAPSVSIATATPIATPTLPSQPVSFRLSFVHTMPGVQSEVYLDAQGPPGTSVSAQLSGPAVKTTGTQSGTLGADGKLRLPFVITRFGIYTISGSIGGEAISAQVDVK